MSSGLLIPYKEFGQRHGALNRELIPRYERDLIKMTRLLLNLNANYNYTAFWTFWGNTSMFDVRVYHGGWNWLKHPMAQIGLQVSGPILYDIHNQEPFDIQAFERFNKYLINNSSK